MLADTEEVGDESAAVLAAEVSVAVGRFFRLIVSVCSPYGDGALMIIVCAEFVFCLLLAAVAADCDEPAAGLARDLGVIVMRGLDEAVVVEGCEDSPWSGAMSGRPVVSEALDEVAAVGGLAVAAVAASAPAAAAFFALNAA